MSCGNCVSKKACDILKCIRSHPLFDTDLECSMLLIKPDSDEAFKKVLSHFEKKQPPKVSYEDGENFQIERRTKKYQHIGRCYYCEKEFCASNQKTRDHIIPISKGGKKPKSSRNVIECCQNCNKLKGDLYLEDFLLKCEKLGSKVLVKNISALIETIAPYKNELSTGLYQFTKKAQTTKKKKKKSKPSLVGAYLQRQKEINPIILQGYNDYCKKQENVYSNYTPGRIETPSEFIERSRGLKWEYDKRPNETLAEAEERRRIDALPLLERIKITLREPDYNFHEDARQSA